MTTSVKWTVVFNSFDPFVPLSGDKLDAWFVGRELSPLSRLEFSLQPDHLEQKVLLVGQRGCGKTSELFKLISRMQDDYFTVYVDLFGSLDLEMTSRIELLFCIGTAVYKSAVEAGLEPPERLWKELISSLSTLVREQTRQSSFDIDPVAALKSVLCTAGIFYPSLAVAGQAIGDSARFGFGVGRKDIERLELEPILREVIARVNAIIGAVEKKASRPVLLVADGLDKIERKEQAEFVFGRSWVLTAIQCRALYTVPVVLYCSTRFRSVRNYFSCEELPNVRLHAKGEREQPDASGFSVMQSLVEKRLKAAGLDIEHVFAPEALQLLIKMSGGLMRDMVTLVRQAVIEAGEANRDLIGLQEAQLVVNRMRREWEAALYKEHYLALESIERSGGMVEGKDPFEMDLVRERYVVSYENGGFWRDIHPLALLILEDYKAQKRLLQFQDSSKDDSNT